MLEFILPKWQDFRWWLGIALVSIIAAASLRLAALPFFLQSGLGALAVAIATGIIIANTIFPKLAVHTHIGVDYAKNILLRAGIILYGFRITFQQIIQVGWAGILIDITVVSATFFLSLVIGRTILKMDKETTVLIGTGSAICGAAAIMAAEPVIKAPTHKVTIAVATVVVFGTIALFLYPLLYPYLGLSQHQFGIYIGSTVHEVAQVVAAGEGISTATMESAVIVKMTRVMLLVPFLILLSAWWSKDEQSADHKTRIMIPWFAVLFIVASGISSLNILSDDTLSMINQLSTLLLSMAMAALGLRTHFSAIREAGPRPLFLAGCLFLFLIAGGGALNVFLLKFLHL